jgi:indolepyruvate ferredoxin oxidoreductase beta subunit
MYSCLLCGVGGQGTVLASRLIATAAMEKGLFARTAETIGMAQRGGSVVSHVRCGQTVASPMIPYGQADVIVGFEPGEVARNLHYLKPGGTVIVCSKAVQPVTASLGGTVYDGDEMLAFLKRHVTDCHVIDGEKICAACGSAKVLNVALIGALAQSGKIDLTLSDMEDVLKRRMKPQYLEMNLKALALGAAGI